MSNKSRNSNQTSLIVNLDELNLYLADNKLVLNAAKTALSESMIQQKKGKTSGVPPSLSVQNERGEQKIVEDKSSIRILGATIQNNMLWKAPSGDRKQSTIARKLLGQLKHHGKIIPQQARKNLARGLILGRDLAI